MGRVSFGKYEILAALGSDGVAEFFVASQEGPAGSAFRRLLVLKRLQLDFASDAELSAMLLAEGQFAVRMNHPNVAQVLDVGTVGRQHYLALEFLDGQVLGAIRARSRGGDAFGRELEVQILSDALAGLHHVHELKDYDGSPLGLVHCAFTPQNVFVTYEGHVKLVELGSVTKAGAPPNAKVSGDVRYMSPEQAAGRPVDRRADIFSFGVMLWEAATGRPFWGERSDSDVKEALASGAIPSSPRGSDVPLALAAICKRALASSPEARHPTADVLKDELDGYIRSAGLAGRRREISTALGDLFANDRAKLRRIVDAMLNNRDSVSQPPRGVPQLWSKPQRGGMTMRLAALVDSTWETGASSISSPSDDVEDEEGDDDDELDDDQPTRVGALGPPPIASAPPPSNAEEADNDPATQVGANAGKHLLASPVDALIVHYGGDDDDDDDDNSTQVGMFEVKQEATGLSNVRRLAHASDAPASPSKAPQAAVSSPPSRHPSATPGPSVRPGRRRSRIVPSMDRRWSIAFGAVAVLLVLMLVMLRLVSRDDGAGSEKPRGRQLISIGSDDPSPSNADTITLNVVATPATAKVSIDNGPWLGNPYSGRVPRDARAHQVIVSANGYVNRRFEVSFGQDVVLEVALERLNAREQSPQAALPGAPAPAPAPEGSPTRATGPAIEPGRGPATEPVPTRARLDKGDPWKR